MKHAILIVLSALTVLYFTTSCSDAPMAAEKSGYPIKWLGEYPSAPTNKVVVNNVYFNSTDRTTYIFNGKTWEKMAVSGINGTSIRWLGVLSTFPDTATNHAFFFITDKISYIFTGIRWDTLTTSGVSIHWLGEFPTEPINKKFNDAYFDSNLKCSRIWNGYKWEKMSADGLNGTMINWRGSFTTEPPAMQINDAYYNETDFTSYIKTDRGLMIICKGGLTPTGGSAMVWLGNKDAMPDPKTSKINSAFYNTTDGCSYIFTDKGWTLLAKAGKDGISIIWKGDHPSDPDNPQLNWAYFNTSKNTSFIWNGKKWDTMCKGTMETVQGLSIIWMGEYADEPAASSDKINHAYYNSTNGNSYICTGKIWNLLAKAGKDGLSIIWKNDLDSFPTPASLNWAFYYTKDRNSYIYNGSRWNLLCKGGFNGADGISLIWKGTYKTHPDPAYKNWAYYNDSLGISYIYDGKNWNILAQDGKPIFKMVNATVRHGDTLKLHHNFQNTVFLNAQYMDENNEIHPWEQKSSSWVNAYLVTEDHELHQTMSDRQAHQLFATKSGAILHVFTEAEGVYAGTRFMVLDSYGNITAPPVAISNEPVTIQNISETADGGWLFSYITMYGSAQMVLISSDGSQKVEMTVEHKVRAFQAIASPDSSILCVWVKEMGDIKYTRFFSDGSSIPALSLPDEELTKSTNVHLRMTVCNDKTIQVYAGSDADSYTPDIKKVYRIYPNNSYTSNGSYANQIYTMIGHAIQNNKYSSVYVADSYEFSNSGRHYYLYRFSGDGDYHPRTTEYSRSITFDNVIIFSLGNSKVGISTEHVVYDYQRGVSNFTSLKIFDDTELQSDQRLPNNMLMVEMAQLSNSTIGVTYVDYFYPRSIRYARLDLTTGEPRLILKKNGMSAYLINHTGQILNLSLTASTSKL